MSEACEFGEPVFGGDRARYRSLLMIAALLVVLLLEPPPHATATLETVMRAHADRAGAAYAASAASARELRTKVKAFCEAPDEARLAEARTAWARARKDYGRTEVFRFGEGPIDARRGGVETFVNAWPVDESYIEGEPGTGTGVIADRARYPVLARAAIRQLNQRGGETNVCTGWHAIEFMLWGRDTSAAGPGARPAADFVDGAVRDADRRREYLREITELLCEDLARVADAWQPGDGSYRARFLADPTSAARRMLVGPTLLAGFEMSGERLAVALETRDQEEEHSCFSDTTDADFKSNMRGIESVLRGNGADGLIALVREADAARADALAAALDAASQAVDAIPAPFDAAIRSPDGSPRRIVLERALAALEALADRLTDASKSLGVALPTEPQG